MLTPGRDRPDDSHEYYDGHSLYRYVNQTDWERFLSPSTARTDNLGGVSTATTPLHHLLAFGSHHAAGSAGPAPSGTSRYYSVDIGLVHFIALDLNMCVYPFHSRFLPRCQPTHLCRYAYTAEPYAPYPFAAKPQLAWLEADLAAANSNRERVPWILLTSHYPLYCSICANRAANNVSARAWAGAEFGEAMDVAGPGELTVGAMQQTMLADLEPLMLRYGVDIYVKW